MNTPANPVTGAFVLNAPFFLSRSSSVSWEDRFTDSQVARLRDCELVRLTGSLRFHSGGCEVVRFTDSQIASEIDSEIVK